MNRISLFGVEIDRLNMEEAVETILETSADRSTCRFVVTPNLDHAVLLQKHEGLQSVYRDASLVLADGWPVVLASRLFGRALPERVTGSDLAPALFDQAQRSNQTLRVYLLGAGPGVAERAAEKIHAKWPVIEVVGCYSPPLGFERDEHECQSIVTRINHTNPDLLIVGLGAPKQELWVHRHHESLQAGWALCVGACIDFLAEEKQRAPRWMQRLCLEWLFRLASEPKRLFKRYLWDAISFPKLLLKECFRSKQISQPVRESALP